MAEISVVVPTSVNDIPEKSAVALNPYHFDDELIPFYALGCSVTSLYLKPDCFGGHGKSDFLCCRSEFTCCKPGRDADEILVCQDGLCAIIIPKVCCKGARQVFCCDSRYSFLTFNPVAPLDADFPCLCNILGLTLIYKFKFTPLCCAKWSVIKASA
uniref:Uncharacterized protein n=1 Tax=Chromulina nebulosa TaxID=96789 RepID=A0A7S0XEN9_9STRA|mmetsp:Transcript_887/g.777  ORF Transcript_887/g.777 Transcript_887/m.777 type:complete len:157 (+) Transcript_887:82-552(+)